MVRATLKITTPIFFVAAIAAFAAACGAEADPELAVATTTRALPPDCDEICDPWGSCEESCAEFGFSTNCGDYGVCQDADQDGDGIANSNDNCLWTYNPNQADCDNDGTGTACDALNANYVVSQETLCMVDRDNHGPYYELEKHIDRLYVDASSCGAPSYYDTYEHPESSWCTAGYSQYSCCMNGLQPVTQWWCNHIEEDYCQGN